MKSGAARIGRRKSNLSCGTARKASSTRHVGHDDGCSRDQARIVADLALDSCNSFRTCAHRRRLARRTLPGSPDNSTNHRCRAECRPATGKNSNTYRTGTSIRADRTANKRLSSVRLPPVARSTQHSRPRPSAPQAPRAGTCPNWPTQIALGRPHGETTETPMGQLEIR